MNKSNPDKWIRKAVFDLVDGITVDTEVIKVFDYRVTGDELPANFVLLSTQSSQVDKSNKCEWFYDAQLLIDIVTTYEKRGNPSSRLLADDILDAVRDLTKDIQLDPASGLTIINRTMDFPPDLVLATENENIIRKFLRLELVIK